MRAEQRRRVKYDGQFDRLLDAQIGDIKLARQVAAIASEMARLRANKRHGVRGAHGLRTAVGAAADRLACIARQTARDIQRKHTAARFRAPRQARGEIREYTFQWPSETNAEHAGDQPAEGI